METSIVIARILTLAYLSMALGIIVNPKYYKEELPKLLDSSIYITIYGGLAAIIIGGLITYYHNTWEGNWTVSITVLGWISLIKGVYFFLFPRHISLYKNNLFHTNNLLKILVPFLLILGGFFGYFGFIN